MKSRRDRIADIIVEKIKPVALYVDDESHSHSSHGGQRNETHFKVLVVSDQFKGVSRIERQRLVNALVKDEFDSGLHALSLRCLSTDEYKAGDEDQFESPNCAKRAKTKT